MTYDSANITPTILKNATSTPYITVNNFGNIFADIYVSGDD
ncbi:MAG: hypothetical protein WC422_00345 [Candidatus Paceibacterota bacterium]|jgi:hypothetical protein